MLTQLSYGSGCVSSIELRNLTALPQNFELEAHRGNGALLPVAEHSTAPTQLLPAARLTLRLEVPGNETDTHAWVRLRQLSPQSAIALSGVTECRDGDQLRTLRREVAYPMRDPSFEGEIAGLRGAMLAVLNTSSRPAAAHYRYCSANLFSVPGDTPASRDLQPVCSSWTDVQLPPFGMRVVPVQREDNSFFTMRTQGDAVLLQMLRPVDFTVRTYTVDSAIRFGAEVVKR